MSRVRTSPEQRSLFSGTRSRWAIHRQQLKAKATVAPLKNPKFSLICPVYNVAKYLNEYFASIVVQPEFLAHIEIIVVNDGSTDNSLEILRDWQRRFPHNIAIVDQPNGGLSAARNAGLPRARGTWVTYIDPDDFVANDYFARVNEFIRKHDSPDDPLNVIACNEIFYMEDQDKFVDNHPLNFRFKQDRVAPIYDMGDFIHMSAAKAFFRREVLVASGLEFDHRVRPHFEDGHLFIRLFSTHREGRIGFAKHAIYYYRKRGDGSSLIDISKTNPRRYDGLYEFGYIDCLKFAKEAAGHTPLWAQRTILYDIMWQIRDFLNAEARHAFLSNEQLAIFDERIRELLLYVDEPTIEDFDLANASELHRVALLTRYKLSAPKTVKLFIDRIDRATSTFVVKWYSGRTPSEASFSIDQQPIRELERKQQVHTFLGKPFVYANYARLPILNGEFSAIIDMRGAVITGPHLDPNQHVDLSEALSAASTPPPTTMTPEVEAIRAESRQKHIVSRYSGVWLFLDRDTQADDNAEHLYRFVKRERPDIKAYFVLREQSHDWKRLKAEGFDLIRFGGLQHKYALLNADYVISSHADHYIVAMLPDRDYGDLLQFKFVFLQHGVTKDDLSHWLNGKPMGLMITATSAEHNSIVSDTSRYKFLPSEVQLTGFPRHDALLARAAMQPSKKRVLIMPTWRESAVGKSTGRSNDRAYNAAFETSQFALTWKALLHSPKLKSLLEASGYEATFFPHANIQQYIRFFDLPKHISLLHHDGKRSIQDVFLDGQILITDLSSVAFEMAFLQRPILYYQFDRDFVFSGGHLTRKGYFDYERDGFGPVCLDETSLLAALANVLARDGAPEEKYVLRSLTTFKWRDGRSCQRTIDAIQALRIGVVLPPKAAYSNVDDSAHCGDHCDERQTQRLEREMFASTSPSEAGY